MMRVRSMGWVVLGAIFALLSQPSVLACTACFGKSDSNLAKGMNLGILALLLVITTVLCGVAGFFVFLAKRSNEMENAHAQHEISANRNNA